MATIEKRYKKLSDKQHVLHRPNVYIGSMDPETHERWVVNRQGKLEKRDVTIVPAFIKIFDEIIMNAGDCKVREEEWERKNNKTRDRRTKMTGIKVDIDQGSGTLSVWNNGEGIPVKVHQEHNLWLPEMIFGHLFTSSNYDDDEEKVTSGVNGLGAKLTVIFSQMAKIETSHYESKKQFSQSFHKNLEERSEPKITNKPAAQDFTRFTYLPDYARFGLKGLDEDHASVIRKRVYELAACVPGLTIELDGKKVPIRNMREYAELHLKAMKAAADQNDGDDVDQDGGEVMSEDEENRDSKRKKNKRTQNAEVLYHQDGKVEVVIVPSDGKFRDFSFVNRIATYGGGTHVNVVWKQLYKYLEGAFQKKLKTKSVKEISVKNACWLFVNAEVTNPSWKSQSKDQLQGAASKIKYQIDDSFCKKVFGLIEATVADEFQVQQDRAMAKTDRKKGSNISFLYTKLTDAPNAGRKRGRCSLILTEGDSAKSMVMGGISVLDDKQNYGVFPLKGKLLNVRDSSSETVAKNKEITALKQIMGLEHKKVYESLESLRYSRIIIMTDQDLDGVHIKGLILNWLDKFWPSLLKKPGFVQQFITPLIKITKGNEVRSFFSKNEFFAWKEENNDGKGWGKPKYYKGLGTSTKKEAMEYFRDLPKHLKPFVPADDEDRQRLDLAFSKSKAEDRKDWLRKYDRESVIDHSQRRVKIEHFVDKDLIHFSMMSNTRSIPNVVDGMKPSQRKILFAAILKNLHPNTEVKVFGFAGYVGEKTAYNHGEASLAQTIVNMASNYLGSNNINLLEPRGQFGTRLQGGKDHASPRYIFTTLEAMSRKIFRPLDDELLKYEEESGKKVEPRYYAPVIPMILVNGAEGIGTGWSTKIPPHNPQDIIDNLRLRIQDPEVELPELVPWYRGFKGTIEKSTKAAGKYVCTGNFELSDDGMSVRVTELPVEVWTEDFKAHLNELIKENDTLVSSYEYLGSDAIVDIIIEFKRPVSGTEELLKKFKHLQTTINLTNLVAIDVKGRVQVYKNVIDIFNEFFNHRSRMYMKAKLYEEQYLQYQLDHLQERIRFIQMYTSDKIVLYKRNKNDILEQLTKHKLKRKVKFEFRLSAKDKHLEDDDDGDEELLTDEEEGDVDVAVNKEEDGDTGFEGYGYLINMNLLSLSDEKLRKLQEEVDEKQQLLESLRAKSWSTLWLEDLEEIEAQWHQDLEAWTIATETVGGGKGKQAKKGLKGKFGHGKTISYQAPSTNDASHQKSQKKRPAETQALAGKRTKALKEGKAKSSSGTMSTLDHYFKPAEKRSQPPPQESEPVDEDGGRLSVNAAEAVAALEGQGAFAPMSVVELSSGGSPMARAAVAAAKRRPIGATWRETKKRSRARIISDDDEEEEDNNAQEVAQVISDGSSQENARDADHGGSRVTRRGRNMLFGASSADLVDLVGSSEGDDDDDEDYMDEEEE